MSKKIMAMRATILCLTLAVFSAAADEPDYAAMRAAMVDEVRYYALRAREADERPLSDAVLDALGTVEREKFVGPRQKKYAYDNRPLTIGHGQTISQPYIVALMTDLIEPDADDVVLEIGTGSGYQAAILAGLVDHVYTIEIIEPLANQARVRLRDLGYSNVTT